MISLVVPVHSKMEATPPSEPTVEPPAIPGQKAGVKPGVIVGIVVAVLCVIGAVVGFVIAFTGGEETPSETPPSTTSPPAPSHFPNYTDEYNIKDYGGLYIADTGNPTVYMSSGSNVVAYKFERATGGTTRQPYVRIKKVGDDDETYLGFPNSPWDGGGTTLRMGYITKDTGVTVFQLVDAEEEDPDAQRFFITVPACDATSPPAGCDSRTGLVYARSYGGIIRADNADEDDSWWRWVKWSVAKTA